MKMDWEIRKLGELVDIKTGKLDSNAMIEGGQYPFFTCSREIFAIDKYAFDCEAILLAGNNASGDFNVKHYKGKFNAYQRTYVITIKKDNEILYSYLNHQLVNHLKKFKEQSVGANTKFLKIGMIQGMNIPIPPLPEQQRIVDILNQAFEGIAIAKANAEQNLRNAKELFEIFLQNIFKNKGDDWDDKFIGEICDLMTGGTPSRSKKEYYEGGEIRWLVSGDVNISEIYECEGRITELGYSNSNVKYLPINSVIIALNGQGKTRGMVAMLRTKATCNQSLVSIYPKNLLEILPEYIFYNLKVRYKEIRKITGDTGNDRRGLNMPLIRNIKISFPKSIMKQNELIEQFENIFTETKKLEAIYLQKIADLEELKKSLLQKAFNGELKTIQP